MLTDFLVLPGFANGEEEGEDGIGRGGGRREGEEEEEEYEEGGDD